MGLHVTLCFMTLCPGLTLCVMLWFVPSAPFARRTQERACLRSEPRLLTSLYLIFTVCCVLFSQSGAETPLFLASQLGFDEIVDMLLVDGRSNGNQPNAIGQTPLYVAAANG